MEIYNSLLEKGYEEFFLTLGTCQNNKDIIKQLADKDYEIFDEATRQAIEAIELHSEHSLYSCVIGTGEEFGFGIKRMNVEERIASVRQFKYGVCPPEFALQLPLQKNLTDIECVNVMTPSLNSEEAVYSYFQIVTRPSKKHIHLLSVPLEHKSYAPVNTDSNNICSRGGVYLFATPNKILRAGVAAIKEAIMLKDVKMN